MKIINFLVDLLLTVFHTNVKRIVLVGAYRYKYYSAAFEVIKYHPFNHLVRLAIKMIDTQVFVYVNFPKNSRLS